MWVNAPVRPRVLVDVALSSRFSSDNAQHKFILFSIIATSKERRRKSKQVYIFIQYALQVLLIGSIINNNQFHFS